MKKDRVSKTAEIVAAIRAKHTLYEQPKVFEDSYAIDFCSKRWQTILRSDTARWLTMDILMKEFKPVALEVLGRARYTEDLLDQAINNGVKQYVILGAGFDTFSLRRQDLVDTLTVYEVDFPGTQFAKRNKMLKNYGELPTNLNFVGVDFENEILADGLQRSSYDPTQTAVYSWLGTTMYLSNESTLNTLQSLSNVASKGSEIVFDYTVSNTLKKAVESRAGAKLAKFVARRGEPFIGFFKPEEMPEILNSVGLEMIENLAPADQQTRYHQGRSDNVKTTSRAYFAHARVL